jgi:hypothetical protein
MLLVRCMKGKAFQCPVHPEARVFIPEGSELRVEPDGSVRFEA